MVLVQRWEKIAKSKGFFWLTQPGEDDSPGDSRKTSERRIGWTLVRFQLKFRALRIAPQRDKSARKSQFENAAHHSFHSDFTSVLGNPAIGHPGCASTEVFGLLRESLWSLVIRG